MAAIKSRHPEILAVSTGIALGVAYFLLKFGGINGGLALFGSASLLAFAVLASYGRAKIFMQVFRMPLIWRGVIFSATQILICESIRTGSATAALSASVLGSVTGVACGRIILKETIHGKSALGLLLAVVGALLCLNSAPTSIFAVVAGLLVGLNSTLTRSLLKSANFELLPVIAIPLLYAGLIMTGFEVFRFGSSGIEALSMHSLVSFVVCLLFAQIMTCVVLKQMDSQKVAGYTLTRLPMAATLEALSFGKMLPLIEIGGMILIAAGAGWLFYNETRKIPCALAKNHPR